MIGQRKKNIIAAFENAKTADAVPIWELEFHLWDILGKTRLLVGNEFVALTAAEQENALHTNAETIAEVAGDMNFSAITVPGNYWEVAHGVPSYYWLPDEARIRQIKILAGLVADESLLVAHTGGILSMPNANDYISFSYKLFDAPEEIDELASTIFNAGMETAKRFRNLGVQGMCSPSDIADNKGVFFNPEQMQRHILPYLRKWSDQIRKLGAYSILHSDGNLSLCIKEIASSGIDALQAIDPVAGMDMNQVRREIGDSLCLCGNVDCGLLLTGTPEEVYRKTCELLDSRIDDERFVLGASNAVQREVPEVNYRAMIEAWTNHGRKRDKANSNGNKTK
jgi:uroporphyrinogen decarboxylase